MAIAIRKSRLTPAEEAFIEAYADNGGDAEGACVAANLPVANAPSILARPHIKALTEAVEGFRPASDMDEHATLQEILSVARDARKKDSFAASVSAYRLFTELKAALPEGVVYDVEAEMTDLRKRVKSLRGE